MHVCEYAVNPPQGKVEDLSKPTAQEEPQQSIYERIGGHEAIEATLLRFHQKGCDHPELQHWFQNVQDSVGSGHLRSLMLIGFGGPNAEEALSLRKTCETTGITLSSGHFGVMMNLFSEAMEELAIVTDVASDVIKNLGSILDDMSL